MKRDMLLHSVGTHPVEEKYVTLAATMRGGVLNKMSSEILNCSSKTDMQVADSVSTAGPRDVLPPAVVPTGCFMRAVRQETHFVTCTLCWVCKAPSISSVQSCGPRG